MSFSFDAAGTKVETLESLDKAAASGMTPDGEAVLALVTKIIDHAVAEGGDGTPIRFTVNASGHTGRDQVPFLNVVISAEYVRR